MKEGFKPTHKVISVIWFGDILWKPDTLLMEANGFYFNEAGNGVNINWATGKVETLPEDKEITTNQTTLPRS